MPTDQWEHFADLANQWDHIEGLYERIELTDLRDGATPRHLTARSVDAAHPVGPEAYVISRTLIDAAMDNLRALRLVLASYGTSPWAPWVLLRSTFEAAILANWLLDPDYSLERRRRALRRIWEDHRQWRTWNGAFTKSEPSAHREYLQQVEKVERRLRRQAVELGMTWQDVTERLRLDIEIASLKVTAALPYPAEWAANIWRSLSGLTHGFTYAMIATTSVEGHSISPRYAYQVRGVKKQVWQAHAGATTIYLLEALQLYERRSLTI